jgi:hypothetical protein
MVEQHLWSRTKLVSRFARLWICYVILNICTSEIVAVSVRTDARHVTLIEAPPMKARKVNPGSGHGSVYSITYWRRERPLTLY